MRNMKPKTSGNIDDFDANFRIYQNLMQNKVERILLVSTPYDAFILEEDGSLASRIIHEYRGLNLSRPPRLTFARSGADALAALDREKYDLVIVMPLLEDMDTADLVFQIKGKKSNLPILLLAHGASEITSDEDDGAFSCSAIDNIFVWMGDAELFLALVKSVEDGMNADSDTEKAMVRVIILVEDSPLYRSVFLPLIYKLVVKHTQSIMEESLNEEHRMLKMRARPKILLAENYEKAMALFEKYKPYVFGVISDTRYPRNCAIDENAGVVLLSKIKDEIPHLPLLLMSSESENREKAEKIGTMFVDKNSPDLFGEIGHFFKVRLSFGDFVFRDREKVEIGRASNLRQLAEILPEIPDEPIWYHGCRNHFSNWIMARSEIPLAIALGKIRADDFENAGDIRQFLVQSINALRRWRQKGVVLQFDAKKYDAEIWDFTKIGRGSLGGKARGLAFAQHLLRDHPIHAKYPEIDIFIPKTLVISTAGFDSFVSQNRLDHLSGADIPDDEIAKRFVDARMPDDLYADLRVFVSGNRAPLSVRSSSIMEDARYQPYAGLYKTVIIPNAHPDTETRVRDLAIAVKLVFASMYFKAPLTFSKSRAEEFQKAGMAVIVQETTGKRWGNWFYPAISGVAGSYNYYPVAPAKPEEGIAQIAIGFGKIFDEDPGAVRFSPQYPSLMPQFTKTEDILKNAQRFFYALKMKTESGVSPGRDFPLEKREIFDAGNEFPIRMLSGTYIPEEDRIRDTPMADGIRIPTFSGLLKASLFPLGDLLSDLLEIGKQGMGCPVEIEFAANLRGSKSEKHAFGFLQMRPLGSRDSSQDIRMTEMEVRNAVCLSHRSLGNGKRDGITDIVYVDPDKFDPAKTVEIAGEISKLNATLVSENRPYVLAGPGRWGSADRWLGIPVRWADISGVCAIIELRHEKLNADPSHGSHFFRKITTSDIIYMSIGETENDFFGWERVLPLRIKTRTDFVCHAAFEKPATLKCDGKKSMAVIF